MAIVCVQGVQSFEDRCSIRCCVVEAGRESSAVNVLDELVCDE